MPDKSKPLPKPVPPALFGRLDSGGWLAAPHEAISRYFDPEGPLAAGIGAGYSPSFVQTSFAQSVTDSAMRGVDDPGRVKFIEADTGVGKTHGYLAPGLLHCVLTGQRMVVSTYTNELKAQVGWEDGPVACEAVERMTGVRPTIALHLAYAEFASPERCRNAAARLLEEGRNEPEVAAAAAAALAALADWTDAEIEFAMASQDPQTEVVAAFRGIVSSWQRDFPALAEALPKELNDLWCVDVKCSTRDLFLRGHYAKAAATATCVVCTHALLLIDLKLAGRVLGGRENPYALTVVDEAHRMDDAARSVLGIRVALSSIERSISLALHARQLDEADVPDGPRIRLGHATLAYDELFAELARVSLQLQERAKNLNKPRITVNGDEEWLATFAEAARAAKDLAGQLHDIGTPNCVSTAESLEMRAESTLDFVAAARDPAKRSGRAFVSFSPLLSEPSLVVEAKFGSRITQRLWSTYSRDGGREPSSKATVFTSATLAQPGARKGPYAFKAMEEMLGLDLTPGVLLPGETYSPPDFGEMTFAFPSPYAPDPSYHNDPDAAARYNRYAAYVIGLAASERSGPEGRCKVLVLTKSFAETYAIGQLLAQGPHAARVMAREKNYSLGRAKKWFTATDDAILVTPGAWEGLNMPRQIDHLVLVRLPFVPPEDGFGLPIARQDADLGTVANTDASAMMRRLRQGFGRGIRHKADVVKCWVADKRFGLPSPVQKRTGLIGTLTGRSYQACIPPRFQKAADAGQVIPLLDEHVATAKKNRR